MELGKLIDDKQLAVSECQSHRLPCCVDAVVAPLSSRTCGLGALLRFKDPAFHVPLLQGQDMQTSIASGPPESAVALTSR